MRHRTAPQRIAGLSAATVLKRSVDSVAVSVPRPRHAPRRDPTAMEMEPRTGQTLGFKNSIRRHGVTSLRFASVRFGARGCLGIETHPAQVLERAPSPHLRQAHSKAFSPPFPSPLSHSLFASLLWIPDPHRHGWWQAVLDARACPCPSPCLWQVESTREASPECKNSSLSFSPI